MRIQLKIGLSDVTEEQAKGLIAYEPVWAIVTESADEGYANEKHGIIKDTLRDVRQGYR